jgi:LysM repeat protein
MQALRQFGTAIVISVVSLGLVVGGLSLALSENFTPAPATEVTSQPTAPAPRTVTATPRILPTQTLPSTETNTALPPSACTPPPGWVGVLVGPDDTLAGISVRYQTTSQALVQGNCLLTETLLTGTILFVPPVAPTPVVISTSTSSFRTATPYPCGAPFGWVRYVVQQGDTLYHIATSFGITTTQLQNANCLGTSTTIRVGQLLWVPNVPTRTPEITQAPTFSSPSPNPTEPLTETPVPPTDTAAPTDTSIPVPTATPETPAPQ